MLTGVVRTVLMYLVILVSVRIMGKRQISQLQTSELVVTLLISELAVMPIQQHGQPLWDGIVPIAALVLCEIAVSLFMLKSGKVRETVCGKPVLVIEDGRILQKNMRKLRMSTEDLYIQLRQNGVFSIGEVAYAVIETNGAMSVARNPADDALTPKLAGLTARQEPLEVVVVSDGEISRSSVQLCGKSEDWVRRRIKDDGLTLASVFLMTARRDGKYRIVKKEEK